MRVPFFGTNLTSQQLSANSDNFKTHVTVEWFFMEHKKYGLAAIIEDT